MKKSRMSVEEAKKYLQDIGSEKYVRVMDVLSHKSEVIDRTDWFAECRRKNEQSLESFFTGKNVPDEDAIDLAYFVQGILGE